MNEQLLWINQGNAQQSTCARDLPFALAPDGINLQVGIRWGLSNDRHGGPPLEAQGPAGLALGNGLVLRLCGIMLRAGVMLLLQLELLNVDVPILQTTPISLSVIFC